KILDLLKTGIKNLLSGNAFFEPCLISDLVAAGKFAVLVVPIDLEAPKGRLILPQVQTIRDLLDSDAICVVVKERELLQVIDKLNEPPAIVVCDSQVVLKVAADTPPNIPLTTFSILFSRLKADIVTMARGAAFIDTLCPNSKILIAEACSHHPIGDDIGRVKIPRWFRQYLGFSPKIDIFAGKDYPENIQDYSLIVHCGGCMFNRKQLLTRLQMANEVSLPITNYGICISLLQGVLERTLSPFPQALAAYNQEKQRIDNLGGFNGKIK
ncbi:MAG: [FeFe] hydrogenase H-cluster maturation GTPase HydF, partial [Candidatus Omnitrophica bacterium]|nr:[FeFe] hydrogenase H-cluster maturation GTPase HydF [Candidatus Omnitrophota bacterium]